MAVTDAQVTVKLDDLVVQLIRRIALVGPVVQAAVEHVRFPTPDSMADLEEVVNHYLKIIEEEDD